MTEPARRDAPVPAVILARGLGTRMRAADDAVALDAAQAAAADAGIKALVPVAGRPLIDHILASLADAGVRDVVLVVGPDQDALPRYLADTAPPARVRVRFAEQEEPRGTADAVVAAARVLGDVPFVVGNGDNLYPVDAWRALLAHDGAAACGFDRRAMLADGGIDADRLRAFAVLRADADGRLTDVLEKPGPDVDLDGAAGRWVGMNAWRVTPALVDACRRVPPSVRGELELPEAVRLAIRDGTPVALLPCHQPVLDLSRRRDVAHVAARLAAAPNG